MIIIKEKFRFDESSLVLFSQRMRFISVAVILLLSSPVLFKSWTVVNYWVHYDHYVNVLCENKDNPMEGCNGQCALKRELKRAEQEKENAEAPLEWVSQYNVSVFESSPILWMDFACLAEVEKPMTTVTLLKTAAFHLTLDHPPC